jgi:hypothetical protein
LSPFFASSFLEDAASATASKNLGDDLEVINLELDLKL